MSGLADTLNAIDTADLDSLIEALDQIKTHGGRLFVAGLGGSAANASHAASDLRNLVGIDAICLTDNAAAVTAAANDHGWDLCLVHVLSCSKPSAEDCLLVMSVGGGSRVPPVSVPLIRLLESAHTFNMKTLAVVGPRGGIAAETADVVVRVPIADVQFTTAHTEVAQAAVWHCLVTDPRLREVEPLWEGLSR